MLQEKTATMQWLDKLLLNNEEQLLNSLQEQYQSFVGLKEIIILGMAAEGQRLYDICQQNSIKIVGVFDDSRSKVGTKYKQHIIKATTELDSLHKNTPLIIASHRVLHAYLKLKQKGFINIAPFALLQVLNPNIFAPHMFYENWLSSLTENKTRISNLCSLLVDQKSLEVLDAILGYRLSLDPTSLQAIIQWELYGADDIIQFSTSETYIDGGTYDGDTIRLFKNKVLDKFTKIIGFEPDPMTFKKLVANFANDPRVQPINKGLYSEAKELHFANDGSRGSILSDEQDGIVVPVTSIDEVLNGARATYIKMNIEGAEIPALNGAKRTIAKYKPKLAISVYHRSTDIFTIPELILQLNPEYKLYLRQHDGGVIESVIYAI